MENEADVRDINSPDYDPRAALAECIDLWGSGAWSDSNAIYNLEEVMIHLGKFLSA